MQTLYASLQGNAWAKRWEWETNIGDFSARNDFDDSTEFMSNPLNQDLSRCLSETSTLVLPNEVKGYETVINPFIDEGTLGLSNTDDALDKAQKALEDYIKNNK